jgi:hypothetical protein
MRSRSASVLVALGLLAVQVPFARAVDPGPTTVTVIPSDSIHARWIEDCVAVTVDPVPTFGMVRLYARDPAGDPVTGWVGVPSNSFCSYPQPEPPPGTFLFPTGFEWAGAYTLQAVFTPAAPEPPVTSPWTTQIVLRRAARAIIDIPPVMPGQPIVVNAAADLGDPEVGGSITLVETTGGDEVELGTKAIAPPGLGYSIGEARFDLPGRDEGTYTFEARYSGTSNLWLPSTAGITINVGDTLGWRGPVVLDEGAEWTSDPDITISAPAEHAVWIEVSDDAGVHWQRAGYHDPITFLTGSYTALPAVGDRTVQVRWVDDGGRPSEIHAASIHFDGTDPTTTTPTSSVTTATTTINVPVKLHWSGHDTGSNVARYQVQSSTDGRAYAALSSTTASSIVGALSPNHRYRIRVRAIDAAGNIGAWTYGSFFRVALTEESSSRITYLGTWHAVSSSSAWGGKVRYATSAGARATFRFTGRGIQIVAPVGPTRGAAKVYVDGIYRATINLYASSTGSRRIVYSRSWASSGSHAVSILVVGTAGHPRVDIDAFVVMTPA